jgi:translocation and assembly module TamA
VRCEERGAVAQQLYSVGPPRLLRFGVGIDTEGLVLLRGSWRNSRLGRHASTADISAQGSSKEQRLNAFVQWYWLDTPSRKHLRPSIEFRHQNEQHYEVITAPETQFWFGTTWDNQYLGAQFFTGPTVEYFRKIRGPGPRDSNFLSLETQLKFRTHDFEYYAANPRAGFEGTLNLNMNSRSLWSTSSAQRLRFTWEGLWNFRSFDPPLLVLGLRTAFMTTKVGEPPSQDIGVPPVFLHYLGGANDLRGFGRQEISLGGLTERDGIGGLSSGYADLEARLTSVLPLGFEPLAFLDAGSLGSRAFALDSPLYWSPGFGVRWQSPIGVFRSTLAKGFQDSDVKHWQFFLSYGEEF